MIKVWVSQKNHRKANVWHKLAAEQGNAAAQFNLGLNYQYALGVRQNYENAFVWYELAAEQGHSGAQLNLGLMYDEGIGVEEENVLAHMWYNISAENGNAQGAISRDLVGREMTPEDVLAALDLAHKCIKSNYRHCEY